MPGNMTTKSAVERVGRYQASARSHATGTTRSPLTVTGRTAARPPLVSVTMLASQEPDRPVPSRWLSSQAVSSAAWGEREGVSLLEIAIGGLAAQPGCASVIAGATSAEQVKANAAAGRWEPSAGQLAAIDEIVPPPATGR